MRTDISLTEQQKLLVESHLHLVSQVIRYSIRVNECVCGLGHDDLYQEGCIYLCKAAATYNETRCHFPSYARKVIRNGLLTYCRYISIREKYTVDLQNRGNGELLTPSELLTASNVFSEKIATFEVLDLLCSLKQNYQGVTKRGIEALSMKIQGLGVSEIAALYQVPSTHVAAWISRAVSKLRANPVFMSEIKKT